MNASWKTLETYADSSRILKSLDKGERSINQKHNAGWSLLKVFVDLVRVCFLHISRNSNKFLLIELCCEYLSVNG